MSNKFNISEKQKACSIMPVKLLFVLCFIFLSANLVAQSPINQIGGRAKALSGASVCNRDIWAQYHNQAGLAYLKAISVGIAFQNSFQVKELSTKSLAAVIPFKSLVFGVNYYYFGYPKLNENKFGLSFSKLLGKRIALGGQIDYFYTHIDGEYGSKGTVAGELGIITEPLPNLFIGAHVFNLWHSQLAPHENEYMPTIVKMGASYLLYDKAMLIFELEKDLDLDMQFKTAVEFEAIENFYIRAGVIGKPLDYSFGLGYKFKAVQCDIAFSKHHILGYSPAISLFYTFNNRI